MAHDLSPADTAHLDTKVVMGFVTNTGGKTSHTAIMARALEIPSVVGLEKVTKEVNNGDVIIVDGSIGVVIIRPTTETLRTYTEKKLTYEQLKKDLFQYRDLPAETPDGFHIKLLANIELVEEVSSIREHGAEGIGLYRTEFLYLNRKELPSEEEQLSIYKRVIKTIAPHPVTIRTLDLGGDKFLSPLDLVEEMNPVLGLRAIRLCLKEVGIFKTQLRALWRRGEALTFQAFASYWQAGKPAIPTLNFRWNLDSGERLVELQAGTAQGIDNVTGSDYPAVQSDPSLALAPRLPLSVLYLGMNNTQTPFDDPRVRQAIAMGIDRSMLMENLPPGFRIADNFTPCAIPDGCESEAWYPFDPATARQLLAEAGYPNGFSTELAYRDVVRSYLPQPGKVAQALRSQLRENLGIDLRLRAMEENEFLTQVDLGVLPGLYLLGWGADYPHFSI